MKFVILGITKINLIHSILFSTGSVSFYELFPEVKINAFIRSIFGYLNLGNRLYNVFSSHEEAR